MSGSGSTGAPIKLIITAYTDNSYQTKVASNNPFTAWINPSSYTYDTQILYSDPQAQGSPGPSPVFNRVGEEEVSFELMFDATGVLPVPTGQSYANGVSTIVSQFMSLLVNFDGQIHSPNYLTIGWAQLQFDCVLSSLSTTYTLFMPNGTPLRAKMQVKFSSYTNQNTLAKQANATSPDLTHVVTVQAGDTLPLLCHKIYGNSGYYLKVARFNRLAGFRNLPPGTQLLFPPLTGSA